MPPRAEPQTSLTTRPIRHAACRRASCGCRCHRSSDRWRSSASSHERIEVGAPVVTQSDKLSRARRSISWPSHTHNAHGGCGVCSRPDCGIISVTSCMRSKCPLHASRAADSVRPSVRLSVSRTANPTLRSRLSRRPAAAAVASPAAPSSVTARRRRRAR